VISYPKHVGTTMTRVIEAGRGASPIIFVHGVSAYAHRWLHNLDAMGNAGHHGYAFDLPGHGFATKRGEFVHSVPAYAKFLRAFMDAISTRSAVLVGTSLGGHVVGAAACHAPERVHALVMVGSLGIVEVGATVRRLIASAIRNTGREGIRAKLQRAHADPSLVSDNWVEEDFQINNSYGAKETFERLARYIEKDLDEDCVGAPLARLSPRIPMLLVWGEKDRSVGLDVAVAAHKALPGSRLVVIADAGHAPYFERPLAFNSAVTDFLSGTLDNRAAGEVIYR
jgi:2-hydroxy-6-oxonona-2,4-dienedioate hydrolase